MKTKREKRETAADRKRAAEQRAQADAERLAREVMEDVSTARANALPPHIGPPRSFAQDAPSTKRTIGFGDVLHPHHAWRTVERVKGRQKWGMSNVVRARQLTDLLNALVDAQKTARNAAVFSQAVFAFGDAWSALIAHDEEAAGEVARARVWERLTETIGGGFPGDVWEAVFGHRHGPQREPPPKRRGRSR